MPNHPIGVAEKTKHQSHPKEYTCPHTKLNYCVPCDAVECPGCGMEWIKTASSKMLKENPKMAKENYGEGSHRKV
jgi:hypothetical protein